MALQSPLLPLPPTPIPVISAVDLELIHLTNDFFIYYVHKVFLSAVRTCLPPLLCAKPVGKAGGTKVLATAFSEVSITKDLGTDRADIITGSGAHKFIVIATTGWLVTGRRWESGY